MYDIDRYSNYNGIYVVCEEVCGCVGGITGFYGKINFFHLHFAGDVV